MSAAGAQLPEGHASQLTMLGRTVYTFKRPIAPGKRRQWKENRHGPVLAVTFPNPRQDR